MTIPISAAQQKHLTDNPIPSQNVLLEQLLALIAGQNGDLSAAIQQLIAGTPSTEIHYGADPPDTPTEGDMWYHPDENRLYAYVLE